MIRSIIIIIYFVIIIIPAHNKKKNSDVISVDDHGQRRSRNLSDLEQRIN